MIPWSEETSKNNEKIFHRLCYFLMHSMHVDKDSIYQKEKNDCIKDYGKEKVEEVEQKVINSSLFNSFLRNRGVEGRIVR